MQTNTFAIAIIVAKIALFGTIAVLCMLAAHESLKSKKNDHLDNPNK